ncbi:MAG: pilus assembly protein PilM [Wenzhouxiangellaceae bacterium]|nr:pilus assembly protein PilM [Wenzhouxiangellaceae bacterium]
MKWFGRRRLSNHRLGLFLAPARSTLCSVDLTGERPRVSQVLELATEDDGLPDAGALAEAVRALERPASPLHAVLGPGMYQLLLVEAPDVDADELRQAVRWRIKDLIDFHIDDAVIDVFAIPGQQNRPSGKAQMYTVAARTGLIAELVKRVQQASLQLQVIDIAELALRNLGSLVDGEARGLVTLWLENEQGLLIVSRQGELFMTRHLNFGSDALAEGGSYSRDQVLLEIQRSLDYYTSHFAQPMPAVLRVLPGFAGDEELARHLDQDLEPSCALLDSSSLIEIEPALEANVYEQALLAIGGALRREELSL